MFECADVFSRYEQIQDHRTQTLSCNKLRVKNLKGKYQSGETPHLCDILTLS